LSVKLPDGTKCSGGSNKNRCLVSFVTNNDDGNCVVVTQTGNNVKRSASEDMGKAKPAHVKVEPTTPPKGHRFRKGKKTGGKKTKETRDDTC
jgi:hypothetical protein